MTHTARIGVRTALIFFFKQVPSSWDGKMRSFFVLAQATNHHIKL